jgi:hypothetical protein
MKTDIIFIVVLTEKLNKTKYMYKPKEGLIWRACVTTNQYTIRQWADQWLNGIWCHINYSLHACQSPNQIYVICHAFSIFPNKSQIFQKRMATDGIFSTLF